MTIRNTLSQKARKPLLPLRYKAKAAAIASLWFLAIHIHSTGEAMGKEAALASNELTLYTLALAKGASESKKAEKLTEAQLHRMDVAANNATPKDCRKKLRCDVFVAAGF